MTSLVVEKTDSVTLGVPLDSGDRPGVGKQRFVGLNSTSGRDFEHHGMGMRDSVTRFEVLESLQLRFDLIIGSDANQIDRMSLWFLDSDRDEVTLVRRKSYVSGPMVLSRSIRSQSSLGAVGVTHPEVMVANEDGNPVIG